MYPLSKVENDLVKFSDRVDGWFHGEELDPVFKGTVRDFCAFDDALQHILTDTQTFIASVETFSSGARTLSEGIHGQLRGIAESQIIADSCKFKEASNQIARQDAPSSAIRKLRTDMDFNLITPIGKHLSNNRRLKTDFQTRKQRLRDLEAAKKSFEDAKKDCNETDSRYVDTKARFEERSKVFHKIDRSVFEWLYMLEEYKGDILDSILQTLKYLQYEFFASAAHSVSACLPVQMEFRPMVEMTPEHLEAQVEMELQEEETPATGEVVADFSTRMIEKMAADGEDEGPAVPVDPLSLSSLLSQGFEEGPARKALRLHKNDTQAAMDYLINGSDDTEKRKQVEDSVRRPTTLKRVMKLKAQKEKQKRNTEEKTQMTEDVEKEATTSHSAALSAAAQNTSPPQDLLSFEAETGVARNSANHVDPGSLLDSEQDLLSLTAPQPTETASATDFTKPVQLTSLPDVFNFDTTACSKPPLPAAVAAGVALPRTSPSPSSQTERSLQTLHMAEELSTGAAPTVGYPGTNSLDISNLLG